MPARKNTTAVTTPRLTADEEQAWQLLVALTTRLNSAMDTELQRESGMTHFEYCVLSLLESAPDRRLQLSDLAQKANSSQSRLSHVVTKMERLDWVRREAQPGRRGSHAVLTSTGRRKVLQTEPGYLRTVRSLVFDGLDARRTRRLVEVGDALVAQLNTTLSRGVGRPDPSHDHLNGAD